jgi:hypothetical protein
MVGMTPNVRSSAMGVSGTTTRSITAAAMSGRRMSRSRHALYAAMARNATMVASSVMRVMHRMIQTPAAATRSRYTGWRRTAKRPNAMRAMISM